MALPVGNLFVDPNVKIVAPELPVDEMKYVWDTKQKVYDKNLEDATKMDILARNIKAREADKDLASPIIQRYTQQLKDIGSRGDYENQTIRVNALASDFFGDQDIQQLQKNYEKEAAEMKLADALRAKGALLDFGKDNKVSGYKRETFKSIDVNPETGEKIYRDYTPFVEERLDWDQQKSSLMSNIAREGSSYIKNKLKTIGVGNDVLRFIEKGQYNRLTETQKNKIAEALTPEYLSTAEGNQEYRKLTEIDGLSPEVAKAQIRKSLENIGSKQVSTVSDIDYQFLDKQTVNTGGGSGYRPLPPYVTEGQPTLETDESNIGKTYRDLSDAYYDAAKGNTAAWKTAKQIETDFLQTNGQKKTRTGKTYNEVVTEREKLLKSLKLSSEDEALVRAEINDLNISFTPGEEKLGKLMPSDITRDRLKGIILSRTDSFKGSEKLKQLDQTLNQLMGQDIYDVESEINSFANKGYSAPAYSRVPVVFVGEEGKKASEQLTYVANDPAVKQSLTAIGDPAFKFENADILKVTPFTRPDPNRGVVFKVEYKTGKGSDAKIETKDVYVKRTGSIQNWQRNPLLQTADALTGGAYNFQTADMAAEFGSVAPGQTLSEVVQGMSGTEVRVLKAADKFKFDYKDGKMVVNHINNPNIKLSIDTVADHLSQAFGGSPQSKQVILSLLASRQGYEIDDPRLRSIPVEFDDPNEVDQVLYEALMYFK